MGVNSRTSPGSLFPADAVLIDLQLFGTFNVKSREAYGAEEAQASQTEAPDSGAGDLAQDGGDPQEAIDQGAGPGDEPAGEEPKEDAGQDQTPDHAPESPEKGASQPAAQAGKKAPAGEEWLIPGKFRDVEALKAAYLEAEKTLGRLHRELAQLRRQGASQEKIDAKQAEIQSEEQRAEENRRRLREFLRDPLAYEQRLKEELRRELEREQQERQQVAESRLQTVQQAIQSVASRYPDLLELEPAIIQALVNRPAFRRAMADLQEDPYATPMDYAALIEDAYTVVKSEVAARAVQAAREQGRQEATQALSQRRQATVTGQGARRTPTTVTPEQRLIEMIVGAGGRRSMWREEE